MRIIFLMIVFAVRFTAGGQDNPAGKSADNVFPGREWEYNKDPSKQGWNTLKLIELQNFIVDSSHTTGMMVIQHGKVVFHFGDTKEVSYIAACRKSILAMLYGPFVEKGVIDLERSLGDLGMNDVGGLLPIEKKSTVKNILTARSGVYHAASIPGDESETAPARGSVTPGSQFVYNTWDFNAAGTIFEKLSGRDIYGAVDTMLALPLQLQDWNKDIQHKTGDTLKSFFPAYPMWFSTRDMARIGYLMLRNGEWQNRQIISSKWIRTITSPFTSFEEAAKKRKGYSNFGYGYFWWVWDAPFNTGAFEGAYTAMGSYGQFITVLPKLDLVVAHKTKADYERVTSQKMYLQLLKRLVASNNVYAGPDSDSKEKR